MIIVIVIIIIIIGIIIVIVVVIIIGIIVVIIAMQGGGGVCCRWVHGRRVGWFFRDYSCHPRVDFAVSVWVEHSGVALS